MILVRANVPAAPVFSIRDVVRDPQVRNRRMIAKLKDGTPHLGLPIRLYKTKPKETALAPFIGQHSMEILAELGYSSKATFNNSRVL